MTVSGRGVDSCRAGPDSKERSESLNDLCNVARDPKFDVASDTIEVNRHAQVAFTLPANGELIFELQAGNKVLGVGCSAVLHAEVVDDQGERCAIGRVPEQARGGGLNILVLRQVVDKRLLCDTASVWKTVHAAQDFKEDLSMLDVGVKAIFVEDRGGKELQWD